MPPPTLHERRWKSPAGTTHPHQPIDPYAFTIRRTGEDEPDTTAPVDQPTSSLPPPRPSREPPVAPTYREAESLSEPNEAQLASAHHEPSDYIPPSPSEVPSDDEHHAYATTAPPSANVFSRFGALLGRSQGRADAALAARKERVKESCKRPEILALRIGRLPQSLSIPEFVWRGQAPRHWDIEHEAPSYSDPQRRTRITARGDGIWAYVRIRNSKQPCHMLPNALALEGRQVHSQAAGRSVSLEISSLKGLNGTRPFRDCKPDLWTYLGAEGHRLTSALSAYSHLSSSRIHSATSTSATSTYFKLQGEGLPRVAIHVTFTFRSPYQPYSRAGHRLDITRVRLAALGKRRSPRVLKEGAPRRWREWQK